MAEMTQMPPAPAHADLSRQEIRALMATIWREEGDEYAHLRSPPPPAPLRPP